MTSQNPYQPARQRTTAQMEREELAGLLRAVGPDAPTLCEGWTTRDLAVHLVVREHRPDAAAGMFISALARHLSDVSEAVAQLSYERLVEDYLHGPPKWNPMRLADRYVNTAENFIHHEDVRRAAPEWTPRELSAGVRDELWDVVQRMSRLFLRASRVHVVLERTDATSTAYGSSSSVCRAGARDARDEVRVVGEAPELLLWLFGRDGAARVAIVESAPGVAEMMRRQAL